MAGGEKPSTIAEYLDAAPEAGQAHLRELYALLRAVAPDATESMKWSQPAFGLHRILYCFAGYRDHANLMPTPASIEPFAAEIAAAGLKATKGVVMIPYAEPFPADLIRRIAERRARDLRENDAKFMV